MTVVRSREQKSSQKKSWDCSLFDASEFLLIESNCFNEFWLLSQYLDALIDEESQDWPVKLNRSKVL